jgi:hypothetical protein
MSTDSSTKLPLIEGLTFRHPASQPSLVVYRNVAK